MALANQQRPPFVAGQGLEWRVYVEDRSWRVITGIGRPQCRRLLGGGLVSVRCGNAAEAALNRTRWTPGGRVDAWWAYCLEHMYGRWIEEGRVVTWRLCPVTRDEGQRFVRRYGRRWMVPA